MASTVLQFGAITEEIAREIDHCMRMFLEKTIHGAPYCNPTPNHYGPIVYNGVLHHSFDGVWCLSIQSWNHFAENLFFIMDEFLRECMPRGFDYTRSDMV